MRSLLLSVLTLLFIQLSAQSDSIEYDLPNVIIKENRIALPFADHSRSIQVITAAQIAEMPVQSVNELLLTISGVDVRQRGPHGVQADIGIRGGTFDQTLVLLNGVKLTDPQTGHHNMNLPVDLANIERIEVLKGPAARVYGQNAFSGAINIVTKTVKEDSAELRLRAGDFGLWGVTGQINLAGEQLSHSITIAHDASDGYQFNTDYNITTLFYQNALSLGEGNLQLMAGYSQRNFGANGFYASPDFMDQYEEVTTSLINLEYQTKALGAWQLTSRAYWRRNVDDYVFIRDNPSVYQNIHTGHSYGLEAHANRSSKLGTTGLGAELNQVDLSSNNLGERARTVLSLFAEHRFAISDRLDVTPGVSFSNYSDFGNRFFPGVDLGYRLSNRMKAYGNVGYTYRVPTFTDLYYEDRANNGNPQLEPEEALAYELGLQATYPGLQWQAAIFQRDGLDLIDWTRNTDTTKWTPINITELTTRGAELSIQAYLPILLNGSKVIERLRLSYTYLDAELTDNGAAFSRYALENLQHQLTAGITYRILPNLRHSISYRYSDRVNLDNYSVIDTRLRYDWRSLSIFTEATNVLDTKYQETNLVTMPGRWWRLGLSWQWSR